MIRRASLADAEAAAAVFTASFASMRFVPKLHTAEEDRAFVRGLIAASTRVAAVARSNGRTANATKRRLPTCGWCGRKCGCHPRRASTRQRRCEVKGMTIVVAASRLQERQQRREVRVL